VYTLVSGVAIKYSLGTMFSLNTLLPNWSTYLNDEISSLIRKHILGCSKNIVCFLLGGT
jgi:hypothetical protein